MLKKIIVPTDFSETALTAARYACQLAIAKNYAIHLLHCYSTESVNFENSSNFDDDDSIIKADLLILNLRSQLSSEFPTINFETECTRELLEEVLLDKGKSNHSEIIIMGTNGLNKNKSAIWGSNTRKISSKSNIPVLAIPSDNNKFSFKKLALLTNFKPEELDTLKEFIHLISDIQQLDLIHVYKDPNDKDEINEKLETWSYNIKELCGVNSVNCITEITIPNNEDLDTIPEVINKILSKENYDTVLVTKIRKSFFTRLFNPSVSKEVILNLQQPTFFDKN